MVLSNTSTARKLAENDASLNHDADQISNLDPRLRQLNLKLATKTATDLVSDPSSALLLLGAVGFFLRRKFAVASFFAAGLILQQAVLKRPRSGRRETRDIELERYALKAQRGDYGKLEVIAFK